MGDVASERVTEFSAVVGEDLGVEGAARDSDIGQVRVIAGSTDTVVLHNPFGNRVAEGNVILGFTLVGSSYWGTRPVAYYTASPAATHFEHQDYLGTRSSSMAIASKRFALPAFDPLLSSRDILNKKSGSIAR